MSFGYLDEPLYECLNCSKIKYESQTAEICLIDNMKIERICNLCPEVNPDVFDNWNILISHDVVQSNHSCSRDQK